MAKFDKHIFICINQRDSSRPRGCYDPSGKGEFHKFFKEKIKASGLHANVRANKAGCLDQCEHGQTIVVYPEAVWYGQVQPEDVDEIIASHHMGGVPVPRLRLPDGCINTAECEHKRK